MNNKDYEKKQTEDILYIEAEADANRFNLRCLFVLCLFVLISEVLNEIGVFKVPVVVMRVCTLIDFVLLSIPLIVFLIHDRVKKSKKKILENELFKHLIITSTYLGIAIVCVALSFHAVILVAIPPLVAAQYHTDKKLFTWVMIVSFLLVFVGVYGSFFLGTADRNFIKGMMSEEDFAILSNRISLATSSRMLELFTHYVLPRIFGVNAIILLVFGITRRNGDMLKKQVELDKKVNQEMEQLTKMQGHVIDALATLIETRDIGTGEHVVRTKRYVKMIAERLKQDDKYKDILSDEEIVRFENTAPLHDVGKIVVSDTILLKPGKLTSEEFEKMKVHTVKGGKVIRDIFSNMEDDDFLHTAEQIAMYHHERWDGTGYPQGLKGEEIPLSARIMAIADVFDALVSVRVYKKSIPPKEALEIMMSESGTHFDPDIMKIVEKMGDELFKESMTPFEEMC